MKDIFIHKIPQNVTIRFTPTATYDEPSTIKMVKEKYAQKMISQMTGNEVWRGLVIDQFTAQLTPEAVEVMIATGRVPVIIWGHLTPWLQVADRYQNAIFKAKYEEKEALLITEMLRKNPSGVPRLTRQNTIYLVSQTHKDLQGNPEYMKNLRKQFLLTGTKNALDGHEDNAIDSTLLGFWHKQRIPQWRKKFLGSYGEKGSERPSDIYDLIKTFENPRNMVNPFDIPQKEAQNPFVEEEVEEDPEAAGASLGALGDLEGI